MDRLCRELSFSHLLELSRVDKPIALAFYEVEAIKNGWGVRELRRQRDSMLFERVGLSRDKGALVELAASGVPADASIERLSLEPCRLRAPLHPPLMFNTYVPVSPS